MQREAPQESSGLGLVRRFVGTRIHSRRDLVSYVVRITALCVAIALTFDVVNQLTFFEGWTVALRSWALTALIAGAIAVPITRAIGKAHLDLYLTAQVLENLSRTDSLTGLANRRALIEKSEEPPPEALVLVIFDIDRFKRINDTYGHLIGDDVIRTLSERMRSHLGHLGLLCRLGGEEFALIAAGGRAEDVLDAVWSFRDQMAATPISVGDDDAIITLSAGVAIRAPGGSFNQLYADADRALYMAKAAGRNRINYAETIEPAVRTREAERRFRRITDEPQPAAKPAGPDVRSVA